MNNQILFQKLSHLWNTVDVLEMSTHVDQWKNKHMLVKGWIYMPSISTLGVKRVNKQSSVAHIETLQIYWVYGHKYLFTNRCK